MTGLLEKDFRLLMQRKQMLLVFLFLAVVLGVSQEGTFILGYLPFLTMIVTISTISYDEMNHGYQFLMTLPISAKTYVKEKYIFCMGGAIVSWILAVGLYLASDIVHEVSSPIRTQLPDIFIFIPIILVLLSIMIPLQIKYGAEKSRIVLLIICGFMTALMFVLIKMTGVDKVNEKVAVLNQVSDIIIIACGTMLALIIAMVSYVISCRIMKKKEF